MKRKLTSLLVLFILFSSYSFSQDKDSVKLYQWTPVAVANFNLSQVALSNWTQGGDNTISWNFIGTGGLKYKTINWTFRNNLKTAYGQTKLGSSDFRVNDNEFYLESILSRNISWAVDPYVSNSVRTSIAPGYEYTDTSEMQIAGFFDPGYVTQSIGLTYDEIDWFSTRAGFAVQEVFTNKFTQYSDDPDTPNEIEKFKLETGLESVTNIELTVAKNLLYKSNLRLFSRFESLDVWDVRWDNAIVAKINDWLNVNLSYLLIYQKDQSLTAQMKESLQLGVVYTIL